MPTAKFRLTLPGTGAVQAQTLQELRDFFERQPPRLRLDDIVIQSVGAGGSLGFRTELRWYDPVDGPAPYRYARVHHLEFTYSKMALIALHQLLRYHPQHRLAGTIRLPIDVLGDFTLARFRERTAAP